MPTLPSDLSNTWGGEQVLVTGGSGVVGTAVVRHLVSVGADVAALARSAEAAQVVEALGAVAREGDVLDPRSLAAAAADRRFVFHVAGVNEMCPSRPEHLWAVNVDGTRNMLRAANTAGVERLVLTSSVAALGSPEGRPATEQDEPVGRFESRYAESKWASEAVARAESGEVDLVIVNPASVQGPGRGTGTGGLILDIVEGRLPVMVDTTISVVDIDDCAAGHLAAARRGVAGERYILSGFTVSTREATQLLEELLGISLRVRFVPPRLAAVLGPVMIPFSRAMGGPTLCREMVRTLTARHAYDGSRADRELGLTYSTAEETMRRFLAWAYNSELISHPVTVG